MLAFSRLDLDLGQKLDSDDLTNSLAYGERIVIPNVKSRVRTSFIYP